MTTQPIDLCTPWTLLFDRDGTEDFAIIYDAEGFDLAQSTTFWLPEDDEPVPAALAAVRLMAAAPQLLEALQTLLTETVDADLNHGITLTEGEQFARAKAMAAIIEATAASG